jgi:hypothetical protein
MAGGRPTKMTPETLKKIEEAFLLGCTDLEACLYAGISPPTLYTYQKDNKEFLDRKETLKSNPVMKARKVLLDALDDGDVLTAHKIIERKEGTKIKQELSGVDGAPIETKSITFIPVGKDDSSSKD